MKNLIIFLAFVIPTLGFSQKMLTSHTQVWQNNAWHNQVFRVFDYEEDKQVGFIEQVWENEKWLDIKKYHVDSDNNEQLRTYYDLENGNWNVSSTVRTIKKDGYTISYSANSDGDVSVDKNKTEQTHIDPMTSVTIRYTAKEGDNWIPTHKHEFKRQLDGSKIKSGFIYENDDWKMNGRVIFPECSDVKVILFQKWNGVTWVDDRKTTKTINGLVTESITETLNQQTGMWDKRSKTIRKRDPKSHLVVEKIDFRPSTRANSWNKAKRTVFTYSNETLDIETTNELDELSYELYPNPAVDLINIRFLKEGETFENARLYNSKGQIVGVSIEEFNGDLSMDIQTIKSGKYFLIDDKNRVIKFVKN